MARPMAMYLYIHDAILREVANLEDVAKELKWDDPDEIGALHDRLTWFQMMTRRHEDAEEQFLFPAMNDRMRFVAETYQFDHDDFEAHIWEGMDRAFDGLGAQAGKGQRRDHAELLYRQSVALHEHMRLHIAKENELLVPKLEVEFDVPEQAQIAGAMAGLFDPQLLTQTVDFTYKWQTPTDREAMILFLRQILPEEPFNGLTGFLEASNPDTWPETRGRIPDL